MMLDYRDLNELERYKTMSNTVVPRPIAWVVTEDEGVINAAPFSYFIPISSDPALVVIAIGQKSDGSPKDSRANILKKGKATICFVNQDNLEQVKKCATELPKDKSEIETFGIEVIRKEEGFPPVIYSSQSALFCEFYSEIDISGHIKPLILEIKKQFIEDGCIDSAGHISLQNIGRAGAGFKAMVDI